MNNPGMYSTVIKCGLCLSIVVFVLVSFIPLCRSSHQSSSLLPIIYPKEGACATYALYYQLQHLRFFSLLFNLFSSSHSKLFLRLFCIRFHWNLAQDTCTLNIIETRSGGYCVSFWRDCTLETCCIGIMSCVFKQ